MPVVIEPRARFQPLAREADPLGIAAGQSVYGYAEQDSLNLVDPEGLAANVVVETIWDAGNAAFSFGRMGGYALQGDFASAGSEAVNLGADVAAMCTPGVPAGASIARRLGKGPDRHVPEPKRPKKGCTAPCRADANDNIEGNIQPGDQTFATATVTAANCQIAKKKAKKLATQRLGKQPKHIKCRTSRR